MRLLWRSIAACYFKRIANARQRQLLAAHIQVLHAGCRPVDQDVLSTVNNGYQHSVDIWCLRCYSFGDTNCNGKVDMLRAELCHFGPVPFLQLCWQVLKCHANC
jgi:hypothetical protein